MEWQSIQTAPKRGLILAYAPEEVDEKDAKIMPWLNYYGGEYVVVFWNREDGEWDDGYNRYDNDFFTHWLPIPKRPKEENKKWQIVLKYHQLKIGLLRALSLLLKKK